MSENMFGLVLVEISSISVLTISLCVPLIYGAVEMNGVCGIRTKKAFKSKKNLDAINRFGGKAFPVFFFVYGLIFIPTAAYFRGRPAALQWISDSPILFLLPGLAISIFQAKLP
jgi:hypothetical protein